MRTVGNPRIYLVIAVAFMIAIALGSATGRQTTNPKPVQAPVPAVATFNPPIHGGQPGAIPVGTPEIRIAPENLAFLAKEFVQANEIPGCTGEMTVLIVPVDKDGGLTGLLGPRDVNINPTGPPIPVDLQTDQSGFLVIIAEDCLFALPMDQGDPNREVPKKIPTMM